MSYMQDIRESSDKEPHKTDFELVGEFHKKFDLGISDNTGALPSTEVLLFRLQFLQEELNELTKAIRERDHIEITDALVDIAYVVLGTAHLCNVPWQDAFDEIHRSNMEKEAAPVEGAKKQVTKIIKPVFWRRPDLASVYLRYQREHVDD